MSFAYDGDVTTSAEWTGATIGTFGYTFNDRDWLTSVSVQSGADNRSIALTRDETSVITGVGDFTLTQTASGQMASASDGTASLAVSYNSFGEATDNQLDVNAITRYRQQITARDGAGRVTSMTEQTMAGTDTYEFTYDGAGRLATSKKNAAATQTFSYDVNGNLLTGPQGAATFDTADRVTSVSGVTYGHDVDGNLTSRGPATFTYGAGGELRAATVGGQSITYTSDLVGRRVARTSAAGSEQYLYGDPANPFRLTASRGTDGALSLYIYEDSGRLLSIERGATTYYVGTDHLGTPKQIVDGSGNSIVVRSYDVFGNLVSDSNPSFGLPIGFAGGLEDPVTKLVRLGMRDYVPAAGQFAVADPVLFGGGTNLYAYAAGDPINMVDPAGLAPVCIGGARYMGFGGGVELCWGSNPDVFSVCVEGGWGVGQAAGATLKDPANTALTAFLEGGLDCGDAGATAGWEIGGEWTECGLSAVDNTTGGLAKSG